MDDLHRQLAECDENLCGPNLTKTERAIFTRRRKEAYEALHPETKQGGDRKSDQVAKNATCSADRFTADTAAKTGQSERTVQLDAERGNKVADDVLLKIRGTLLDTGAYLDALKGLSHADQRAKLKADIAAGAAKPPGSKPPVEVKTDDEIANEQFQALCRLWNKSSPKARELFLDFVN